MNMDQGIIYCTFVRAHTKHTQHTQIISMLNSLGHWLNEAKVWMKHLYKVELFSPASSPDHLKHKNTQMLDFLCHTLYTHMNLSMLSMMEFSNRLMWNNDYYLYCIYESGTLVLCCPVFNLCKNSILMKYWLNNGWFCLNVLVHQLHQLLHGILNIQQ